ncbi:unnamed protein product, partial [marine sediment metagenome]
FSSRENANEPKLDISALSYTISVQSSPHNGIAITATPSSISGTTNYSRDAYDSTSVTLTAPASAAPGGVDCVFSQWVLDDVVQGGNPIAFGVSGAHEAVAEYQVVQRTLTVQSTPVTGVVISGLPPEAPGTTNYTRQIDDHDHVSLGAPATVKVSDVDYEFVRWTLDTVAQSENPITFYMDADHTAVAEYQVVQRTLTVQSTPVTGISITATPVGAGDTTNYTKQLDDHTQVSLTAPSTFAKGEFQH